ncbi:hypothetical protein MSAN_01357900 [Mycena sanguinolenta]|uniref:Uncharacterized protein n=1 Tax=Mycena sanguinolenta TaxID=230812 RepID=A0A8H6YAU5_9AGAR|nr:hypothetical protein MSAN_01357900 [Mycena sanguinolenta]
MDPRWTTQTLPRTREMRHTAAGYTRRGRTEPNGVADVSTADYHRQTFSLAVTSLPVSSGVSPVRREFNSARAVPSGDTRANDVSGFHTRRLGGGASPQGDTSTNEYFSVSLSGGIGGDGGDGGQKGGDGGDGMGIIVNMCSAAMTPEAISFFRAILGADQRNGAGRGGKGGKSPNGLGGNGGRGVHQLFNVED